MVINHLLNGMILQAPAPFGEILFPPFRRVVFRHTEDFLVARVVPSVAMLVHLGP